MGSVGMETPQSRYMKSEKGKATRKAYYEKNKEKIKARVRKWCKLNPEKRLIIQRRWKKNNPEKVIESRKKHYNPTKKRADCLKRLARKKGAETHPTARLAHTETPCIACGSTKNLEQDHIVPLSKGGSHRLRNLWVLCAKCNMSKQTRSWEDWINNVRNQ